MTSLIFVTIYLRETYYNLEDRFTYMSLEDFCFYKGNLIIQKNTFSFVYYLSVAIRTEYIFLVMTKIRITGFCNTCDLETGDTNLSNLQQQKEQSLLLGEDKMLCGAGSL